MRVSFFDFCIYTGCVLGLFFINYSILIVTLNILSFLLSGLFIIKYSNIKEFRKNEIVEKTSSKIEKIGVLYLLSIFGVGIFIALLDLCAFFKNPIFKDSNIQQINREKRLKELKKL